MGRYENAVALRTIPLSVNVVPLADFGARGWLPTSPGCWTWIFIIRQPPRSTRFPYTPPVQSADQEAADSLREQVGGQHLVVAHVGKVAGIGVTAVGLDPRAPKLSKASPSGLLDRLDAVMLALGLRASVMLGWPAKTNVSQVKVSDVSSAPASFQRMM